MTDDQATRLRALCDELGEVFDASLSAAQAQERIALLQEMKDA